MDEDVRVGIREAGGGERVDVEEEKDKLKLGLFFEIILSLDKDSLSWKREKMWVVWWTARWGSD